MITNALFFFFFLIGLARFILCWQLAITDESQVYGLLKEQQNWLYVMH